MTYHVIDKKHLAGLNLNLEDGAFTQPFVGPAHAIADRIAKAHARRVIDDRHSGYLQNISDNDVLLGVRVVLRRPGVTDTSQMTILSGPYIFDVNVKDDGWALDGVGRVVTDHVNETGVAANVRDVMDNGWIMGTYTEFAKPIPMLMLNKILYLN